MVHWCTMVRKATYKTSLCDLWSQQSHKHEAALICANEVKVFLNISLQRAYRDGNEEMRQNRSEATDMISFKWQHKDDNNNIGSTIWRACSLSSASSIIGAAESCQFHLASGQKKLVLQLRMHISFMAHIQSITFITTFE